MPKSRKPKPQLVREPAPAAERDADATVHPLTGHLRTTFDAILCGTALVQNGLIPESFATAVLEDSQYTSMLGNMSLGRDDDATLDVDVDDDDDAALDQEEAMLDAQLDVVSGAVEGIARSTRILARALIAQALGKPVEGGALTADGRRVDIGEFTLDDVLERLQPASIPAPLRPSSSDLRQAFGEAAGLVWEVGLEEFDAECELELAPKGIVELIAYPVSPESAHLALIGTLFDRAATALEVDDPALALERIAAIWEFDRWSVAPPARLMPPEVADFTRSVRGDEFHLVDRTLVAFGTSIVGSIADDAGFRELFPRQHRMACAFMESFVDVFEVTAVEGPHSTWRSVLHGTSYEVHDEHSAGVYQAGWIAAGRLIPFDEERHLRSLGAILLPPEPGLARKAAETFARMEESIDSALALEAAISSDLFGIPVPRDVKPARSRAGARVVLEELEAAIAEGFALDPTLTTFMKAVERQAGAGDSGGGGAATKHAKGRTRKPTKRRRR
jgi:hypothetical protein